MIKDKKSKYKFELILVVLLLISFSVIVFLGNKNEIEYNIVLNNVVEIAFGNTIGLVSIWISGYFILIQLYKNSYPMEIIERDFLKKVKLILLSFSMSILFGIAILSKWNNMYTNIYFIVLFIINVAIIFHSTYTINRDFKLNTYVDKFLKDISNIEKADIDKCFSRLFHFFEECAVKEEYFICSDISKKIGNLFKELMRNCNNLILSDKKDIAEYMFNEILDFEMRQIITSRNSRSDLFINSLFYHQQKNVIFCEEINNLEWFQRYVTRINELICEIQAEESENKELTECLYMLNKDVGDVLLKKEDENSNWFKWYIENLYKTNISYRFAYKNVSINNYGRLLIYFLISEDLDEKKYDILKEFLDKFTMDITNLNDNIQDIVLYYSIYGNKILDDKNVEKVKDYIHILTSDKNRIIEDEKWNEFIFFYLNITMDKIDEFAEENRKLIIERIIDLSIKRASNRFSWALPNYDMIIFQNRFDKKILDGVFDELEELLIRLIFNENDQMFLTTLNVIKGSFTRLERSDKNVQTRLFDLFINCLKVCKNKSKEKFFYTTINVMEEILEDLNKDKKISNDLGEHIIDSLYKCASFHNIEEDFIVIIIEFLSSFIEENEKYYFINKEMEKYLYRKIYNIGIECIENDQEKGLRTVSNSLGWYIKWSLDNNPYYMTEYLLEITIDLFKISKNMCVSQKTQIFILTLFTIIGTYCCKDKKNNKLLDKIIEFLNKEDYERIVTAIDLRTKENDMWDSIFENNTQKLTHEFLKVMNQKRMPKE